MCATRCIVVYIVVFFFALFLFLLLLLSLVYSRHCNHVVLCCICFFRVVVLVLVVAIVVDGEPSSSSFFVVVRHSSSSTCHHHPGLHIMVYWCFVLFSHCFLFLSMWYHLIFVTINLSSTTPCRKVGVIFWPNKSPRHCRQLWERLVVAQPRSYRGRMRGEYSP